MAVNKIGETQNYNIKKRGFLYRTILSYLNEGMVVRTIVMMSSTIRWTVSSVVWWSVHPVAVMVVTMWHRSLALATDG